MPLASLAQLSRYSPISFSASPITHYYWPCPLVVSAFSRGTLVASVLIVFWLSLFSFLRQCLVSEQFCDPLTCVSSSDFEHCTYRTWSE
jgi:hypothetical protein